MRCESSGSETPLGERCSSSTGKRSASSPARGEPRRKLIRHRDPKVFFPVSPEVAARTRTSESVSVDVGDSPVGEIISSSRTVTISSPAAVPIEPGYSRNESAVSGLESTVQGENPTGDVVESSEISVDQTVDSLGNEVAFSRNVEAIALSDPQPSPLGIERGMENLFWNPAMLRQAVGAKKALEPLLAGVQRNLVNSS